jgi:GH15 family glucan-1,4-alpha-glucosidase
VLREAVDPERSNLVADYGGSEVDAALLQAAVLHFLDPSDGRLVATIDAIKSDLAPDGWVKRYRTDDGFGHPQVAFTICTFWLVEALATVGRMEEARALMERITQIHAPLGLLSEDFDPATGLMWGNFPQCYSHVGMIHAAFAASPRWSEVA